jgi:peptide/nickel transport system permease protein
MSRSIRVLPWREGQFLSLKGPVLLAVFGVLLILPSLLPLDPYRVDLDAILVSPSFAHPLGTDENGRDVLARLLLAARGTLGIGFVGAAIAVIFGAGVGCLAGYLGGAPDALLMRLVDFALAFPSLFVILLISAVFPPGAIPLVALIGLTGWMPVARLVRGSVRELMTGPAVEAARALGATGRRVIWSHLLPHVRGVLGVMGLVQLHRAILAEATISFLGFGIQPPVPTWGNMLIGAQSYVHTAMWLAIAPGLAISSTLLAIHALGIGRKVPPSARRPCAR